MWQNEIERVLIRLLDLTEEIITLLLNKEIDKLEGLLTERGDLLQWLGNVQENNISAYSDLMTTIREKDQAMLELALKTKEELASQIKFQQQARKAVWTYEADNNFIPDAIFFDRKK
ncbi:MULTISPECIES: hypothetical protein [Carboxydocella]|uniref:Flagellar protein FliT n=2 Tax=Carboxydocella TaxID=178898 RepID=A0A1T4QX00_9FIRM|nr:MULTISPECIES: hypothetical protein [Carboxydocella]AVX21675.1 hypothetical protein CFE_2532 [Carboxydocella thermautotrophica]AVX32086.1 hypothetical protein CTH_2547 [Carboxydocella thermautotrophica]GAW31873.1 hypothetical protein JDF658_16380 [Carboxydocella sp. JDF658]SKA07838.1 hypothetical protein SAMN02745885_01826 [Carboxydocella sporoproducens DSM 16521]